MSTLFLVSSLLSLLGVGLFVKLAEHYGWGKPVRKDGPKAHLYKEGTPTMGGLAFLSVALIVWLCLSPRSLDGLMSASLIAIIALLGWADDLTSLRRKRRLAEGEDASTGLLARYRLFIQVLASLGFALYAVRSGHTLFGAELAWLDVLSYSFIITGTINAINFTDGLDGLAGGVVCLLLLPFAAHSPLALCLIGSLLGFLWYNSKPAKLFMGGVGSEALGAAVACNYILADWTWWLPLAAFVPLWEVLSVIIQVSYFRASGGKRIFKMSPIHHHFELSGWSEVQVVMRFWLITALCVGLVWLFHMPRAPQTPEPRAHAISASTALIYPLSPIHPNTSPAALQLEKGSL